MCRYRALASGITRPGTALRGCRSESARLCSCDIDRRYRAGDRPVAVTKRSQEASMSEDESGPRPAVVDRPTFDEQLEVLRAREKAHTREGDAIAAARRRLPMVEVAANSPLLGPHGQMTLLDAFEGRRQLIAYYFMWWPDRPAAAQCEGCTWVMSHVGELAYMHSRDITFAVLCQGRNTAAGPGDAQTSYD